MYSELRKSFMNPRTLSRVMTRSESTEERLQYKLSSLLETNFYNLCLKVVLNTKIGCLQKWVIGSFDTLSFDTSSDLVFRLPRKITDKTSWTPRLQSEKLREKDLIQSVIKDYFQTVRPKILDFVWEKLFENLVQVYYDGWVGIVFS